MTTAIDDHKKEIRDIVCKVLEIDPDELSDDDSFKDEHEMDSMGAIEILAALEQNYNITIDQSELVRMVNLSGVYDVVVEAAGWEREPAG
ncbi:acyl carrier protein [Sphaerisporangium flaviroseum]|uniref:acyl carrier protein n=1 Tax=Sphaerisporangium flaviroseum TaxID=509199 RepID=UPI0031EEB575